MSRGGGGFPLWGPDSRELFYRRFPDGAMMRVEIETDPTFSPGSATVLFEDEGYISAGPGSRAFDIHPDGDRFLMIKLGERDQSSFPNQIIVRQHWAQELTERVPIP